MSALDKTKAFLAIADQFKLGHLVTESFHPKTSKLSHLVNEDLNQALQLLQEVDRDALNLMRDQEEVLWEMATSIQKTLKEGRKVFMCGCGATGRLSMVLETLYRQQHGPHSPVFSFMAGGDFALIKSVESFEDRTDFGARQLLEMGFAPGDLLLAPTEGGETPFVIGAVNLAASISDNQPYFLYCNPDDLLMPIDRSREVINNHLVKKINLTVGPMAISGSTRMQASTVLMLAIGVGLLYHYQDRQDFSTSYQALLKELTLISYQKMAPLTKLEASLYQGKKFLNYVSDPELAISILTDTTERSPTFSLNGFENQLDAKADFSLSYLFIDGASSGQEAWQLLLSRGPRALEWEELAGKIGPERIYGFDISQRGQEQRSNNIPCESFVVRQNEEGFSFQCMDQQVDFNCRPDRLLRHLTVKMLLNAHSTSIMGLLGRYQGNVMTWVRPSNNKLIDRAARYIKHLLQQQGKDRSYPEVVQAIFEETEALKSDEAVVVKVVGKLMA